MKKEKVFKISIIIHDAPPEGDDYLGKTQILKFIKDALEQEYYGLEVKFED